jgi:glycosylphosphatidylinositol transamidase (GPIT) subunit GPI8
VKADRVTFKRPHTLIVLIDDDDNLCVLCTDEGCDKPLCFSDRVFLSVDDLAALQQRHRAVPEMDIH